MRSIARGFLLKTVFKGLPVGSCLRNDKAGHGGQKTITQLCCHDIYLRLEPNFNDKVPLGFRAIPVRALPTDSHHFRDCNKGLIGALGFPDYCRDSNKGMIGTLGIPRDSKKGLIGTLGIPSDSVIPNRD